jgi:hypothetical protein
LKALNAGDAALDKDSLQNAKDRADKSKSELEIKHSGSAT